MKIPERLRAVDRQGASTREFEYDDATVVAVDFGPEVGDVSVDVVGGTVIAVVDDAQFEFELPDDADDLSVRNGVLTIEG